MKKLLIITYYWPPSGGAGVQRWLKLSHYLQEMGVQVYVISPEAKYASYLTTDTGLVNEIHPNIKLIQTKSFEPLNVYKSLVGEKNVPTAGMSNVKSNSVLHRLALIARSNLFIPDPRKYWRKHAVRAALKLIDNEGIEYVITSSPPHSVQLIGLDLKKKRNIKWIADLRDLWTGIYYYNLLQHGKLAAKRDAKFEKKVLIKADLVTTVSPLFAQEFAEISGEHSSKFKVVTNGFDPRDFTAYETKLPSSFIITYTGSISTQYAISGFLKAVKTLINNNLNKIKIRFIGYASPDLIEQINQLELANYVEIIPYVNHSRSIQYLQESYALLLVGPLNEQNKEGSIPAKVFEYLAAQRPIIYIGKKDGFMAKIIADCEAGRSFVDNDPEIQNYIEELYSHCYSQQLNSVGNDKRNSFSREEQAKQFFTLLSEL